MISFLRFTLSKLKPFRCISSRKLSLIKDAPLCPEYLMGKCMPKLRKRLPDDPNHVVSTNFTTYIHQYGPILVAGMGGVALTTLCLFGLRLANIDEIPLWPDYVLERIRYTYTYCLASLGVSSIAAMLLLCDRKSRRTLVGYGPIFYYCYMLVGMMLGVLCQDQDYDEDFYAKHFNYFFQAAYLGYMMSAICYAGGPVMLSAAATFVGMIGGLSSIALCTPNYEFLSENAIVGMSLGGLITLMASRPFLPSIKLAHLTLGNMSLVFWLLAFGAFILHDTDRVRYEVSTTPVHSFDTSIGGYKANSYDPINGALQIYMDLLAIFKRTCDWLCPAKFHALEKSTALVTDEVIVTQQEIPEEIKTVTESGDATKTVVTPDAESTPTPVTASDSTPVQTSASTPVQTSASTSVQTSALTAVETSASTPVTAPVTAPVTVTAVTPNQDSTSSVPQPKPISAK